MDSRAVLASLRDFSVVHTTMRRINGPKPTNDVARFANLMFWGMVLVVLLGVVVLWKLVQLLQWLVVYVIEWRKARRYLAEHGWEQQQ